MDTTVEEHGPEPGANRDSAIFYVIYFTVFPFFFLNIFVALIVVTFKEHGDDELLAGFDLDRNQVRAALPRIVPLPFIVLAAFCQPFNERRLYRIVLE